MNLPAPAPTITPETAEFWSATAQGKLVLRRCDDCHQAIWYPRAFCPLCHSRRTSSFEASGRGTVYTFSIARRGRGAYAEAGPYILALVELDEGPRMLTNIVDCALDEVRVGQPVEVVFHDTGAGTALPRFRPAPPSA